MFKFIFRKQLKELADLKQGLLIQKGILEEKTNSVELDKEKLIELYKYIDEDRKSLKTKENDVILALRILEDRAESLREEKLKFQEFSFSLKNKINERFKDLETFRNNLKVKSEKLKHKEFRLKEFNKELDLKQEDLQNKDIAILKKVNEEKDLLETEIRGRKALIDKYGNFKKWQNK